MHCRKVRTTKVWKMIYLNQGGWYILRHIGLETRFRCLDLGLGGETKIQEQSRKGHADSGYKKEHGSGNHLHDYIHCGIHRSFHGGRSLPSMLMDKVLRDPLKQVKTHIYVLPSETCLEPIQLKVNSTKPKIGRCRSEIIQLISTTKH